MRIIGNDPSKTRQTQRVASGTLPNGKPVVVNADGTVSVVKETSASQSFGSEIVFNAAATTDTAAVYDTVNNKVVILYSDAGNSSYGTAVVGTVSGDSITFGTSVVFAEVNSSEIKATYDSGSEKVIVVYKGTSSRPTAIVGTVSGTSISFGSSVVVDTNSLTNVMDIEYDVASDKVVVCWPDSGSSNYGKAKVGTVSGTSISFGTEVVFNSSTTINICATYDSVAQKIVTAFTKTSDNKGYAVVGTVSGTSISFGTSVAFEQGSSQNLDITYNAANDKTVIAYRDGGDSDQGKAIVGTVSDTSISFGTASIFNAATTTEIKMADHSLAGKVVIIYRDFGNSNSATAIAGTVSGTSISFGSEGVFNGNPPVYGSIAFDPNERKMIISYRDEGNSNYGTAIVMTVAETYSNLTAENYIGIAKSGAADGDGVVVNTKGNVDTGQTGLTAGQSYYVQTDGTLSTTADDPSVFAGTAVSATKLIVKG